MMGGGGGGGGGNRTPRLPASLDSPQMQISAPRTFACCAGLSPAGIIWALYCPPSKAEAP